MIAATTAPAQRHRACSLAPRPAAATMPPRGSHAQADSSEEHLSGATEIIFFDPPRPRARRPVEAPDGSVVLDFTSEEHRARFRRSCSATVASNCRGGARATCSLRAMDACRGPSWLRWLGWRPRKPWAEVDACEEAALQACLASSAEACEQHAQEFCELVARPLPLPPPR